MPSFAIEHTISQVATGLAKQNPDLNLSKKEIEQNLIDVYKNIYKSVSTVRILKMAREMPLTQLYINTRIYPEKFDIDPAILKKSKPEDIEELIAKFNEEKESGDQLNAVDAFIKCKHAVALGGPGFGKTTFSRFLVKRFIENGFKDNPSLSSTLPLFLPFKDILKSVGPRADYDIDRLISIYLAEQGIDEGLALPFLKFILKNGKGFIAFDAFDEARPELRSKLREKLKQFVKKFSNNLFLITSRPAAFDEKDVFDGFRIMVIDNFTTEEMTAFIENWFFDRLDMQNELKKSFESNHGINELGRTPLLCAFICMTLERNLDIPDSRVDTYDKIIDLLIKDWRVDQGLAPKLYIEKMVYQSLRRLLAKMAWTFLEKGLKIFPKKDAVDFFKNEMDRLGQEYEDAGKSIKQIEETSGLLTEQAEGWISFSHLTLQEFLAAEYISKDEQLAMKALKKRKNSNDWEEVFIMALSLMNEAGRFLEELWKGGRKQTVLKALQGQPPCGTEIRKRFFVEAIKPVLDFYKMFPVFHFYKKSDLRDMRDMRYLKDMRDMRDMIEMIDMIDMSYLGDLRYLRDMIDLRYMRDMIYMRYLQLCLINTFSFISIYQDINARKDQGQIWEKYLKKIKTRQFPNYEITDLATATGKPEAYETIMEFYDDEDLRHCDLLLMAVDCKRDKAVKEFHERFKKEDAFYEKAAYASQLLDEKHDPAYDDILKWIRSVPLPDGIEIRLFFAILLWFEIAAEGNKEFSKTVSILKKEMKPKTKELIQKLEYRDGWEKLLQSYKWL